MREGGGISRGGGRERRRRRLRKPFAGIVRPAGEIATAEWGRYSQAGCEARPQPLNWCHACLLRSRVACAAGPLVYLRGARGATAAEGRAGHRSLSQGKTDWGGDRAERHGSG